MKPLTGKQKRFCDEYLIDCNGTQAAIRAGYSPKTANVIASSNLTKVNIKAYIEQRMKEIEDEQIADAKEVMKYLTSVLRGESEAEIVVVEGDGDGMSSARRITKAPDEREKLKAAELIGKRYGIFTEKVNVEGAIPVIIHNDLEDDEDDST
ncbi:terminase small subunit [Chryseomicrobium palamuruense]|uniref:Terminase small subunit n=1 Tax=Chryseomicrobium palamuruense TaxID=682973 RepID=A0ABV8UWH8_9BACL